MVLEIFDPLMDVSFGWALGIDPLYAIGIMSLVVSLLISIIHKYTTDQNLMKRLKDEMKELQAEAKELRDHPEKAMAVQRQMMETNMKYMGQSMRATVFTLLPIIIIFGWMSAHFAFIPLYAGDEFTVTALFDGDNGEIEMLNVTGIEILSDNKQEINANQAQWALKGDAGQYNVQYAYKGKTYTSPLQISGGERAYAPQTKSIGQDGLESIRINYEKLRIFPWLGWGWLGSYILFSILFSSLFRKWMKIY